MANRSSKMMQFNTLSDVKTLVVRSSAFTDNGLIPRKYTCEGDDINPPLDIRSIPAPTKSLALIVDDPDAPAGTWLHWLLWNIPVTYQINEDEVPGEQGMNDFGRMDYGGPCPPSGTHRYFFRVYALDEFLDLAPGSERKQLEAAMQGHLLAYGELVGRYKRN